MSPSIGPSEPRRRRLLEVLLALSAPLLILLALLLILLGISAGLAWLAESPQRSVPPAGRSGDG